MEIKFDKVNYYLNRSNKLLDNISFSIKKNTIVGLIGKSGSGKTLIFELLSGLKDVNSGKIIIKDIVINKKKIYDSNKLYENVYYQCNNLFFTKKLVKDEVKYFLKLKGFKYDNDEISKYLELLDLNFSFLDKKILLLSSGEVLKLRILLSLLSKCNILLYDDVTCDLDNKAKNVFIRLLKHLRKNYNKTILVISRDVELIHKLCDEVIIMDKGKLVACSDKYTIFTNGELLKKYDILMPKVIIFSNLVLREKNIKMGYRDDINDLLKDIYRYVK